MSEESRERDWIQFILKLATCSLFLGRGVLYLSGYSPLTAFFWNQDWLEPIVVRLLGVPWEAYAATSEPLVSNIQYLMGSFFIACSIVCWWISPTRNRWASGIILAGTVILIPYWILCWANKDFQSAMFLEHFLQWGTPLLLVLYDRIGPRAWYGVAWLFTSCTFFGHGQYAFGLGVPQSNDFLNMCIRLLGVDAEAANLFLQFIGILDFALPVLLLIPYIRFSGLLYATVWGTATALARVMSHWTPAEDFYGMHPWAAETIVRLAHGLVPLAMLLIIFRKRE
ncbi:MAG: hypothetical protein AB3N63_17560 [Puniceicoccaceae bacterium]